eukprot:2130564-Amphidinium_carterae.2
MPPSWVWNRCCSECNIHVCCKHAQEVVTPEYSGRIATEIGHAVAHVPIGSSYRFYVGEEVRVLCTTCVVIQQQELRDLNDGQGQEQVPFEQRIYFRSIVPPKVPEWNGL